MGRESGSLLNKALKVFMWQRDYAGAIIIVSPFSLFKVFLDNKSYYSIVKLLIQRVWVEAQGPLYITNAVASLGPIIIS